jgi:hypothetical protein
LRSRPRKAFLGDVADVAADGVESGASTGVAQSSEDQDGPLVGDLVQEQSAGVDRAVDVHRFPPVYLVAEKYLYDTRYRFDTLGR